MCRFVAPFKSRQERLEEHQHPRVDSESDPQCTQSTQCNTAIYVHNFADYLDDSKLRALFEPYGRVLSADVMRDEHGCSRGFGFVTFDQRGALVEGQRGALGEGQRGDVATAVHEVNGRLIDATGTLIQDGCDPRRPYGSDPRLSGSDPRLPGSDPRLLGAESALGAAGEPRMIFCCRSVPNQDIQGRWIFF